MWGLIQTMIGIQYLKYYPTLIYSLPNGLSIYQSQFSDPDGNRGIVGGPHNIFTEIHKRLGENHINMSYLSSLTRAYQNGYKLGLDISLLDIKETRIYFSSENRANEMNKHSIGIEDNPMEEIEQKTSKTKALYTKKYSRGLKTFEEIESAGI